MVPDTAGSSVWLDSTEKALPQQTLLRMMDTLIQRACYLSLRYTTGKAVSLASFASRFYLIVASVSAPQNLNNHLQRNPQPHHHHDFIGNSSSMQSLMQSASAYVVNWIAKRCLWMKYAIWLAGKSSNGWSSSLNTESTTQKICLWKSWFSDRCQK